MTFLLPILIVSMTIVTYQLMKLLYKKFYTPILVPIATTTFLLIIFLLIFKIPYDTYMIGGKWIVELLGPAVVALALPLYQNRRSLKQYFLPISSGVVVGSVVGILSGLLPALWLNFDQEVIISIIPKSVTTPVAMDLAAMTGGVPTLAAVFVTIAGIGGSMLGPLLLKKMRIKQPIGVGVAFGTASHGIGTAKALEIGKDEAAISSIAMILSAIITSVVCPFIIMLLL